MASLFAGRGGDAEQGDTSRMPRPMHQLKNLRTAARTRFAMMGEPRSRMRSRRAITSRLLTSPTVQEPQSGRTSRLKMRAVSAPVLFWEA